MRSCGAECPRIKAAGWNFGARITGYKVLKPQRIWDFPTEDDWLNYKEKENNCFLINIDSCGWKVYKNNVVERLLEK